MSRRSIRSPPSRRRNNASERIRAIQDDDKITFDPGSVEINESAGVDSSTGSPKCCRTAAMSGWKIAGHTDSQGREEMNLNLSQFARRRSSQRAFLARSVLVSNLTAQGYGESQSPSRLERDGKPGVNKTAGIESPPSLDRAPLTKTVAAASAEEGTADSDHERRRGTERRAVTRERPAPPPTRGPRTDTGCSGPDSVVEAARGCGTKREYSAYEPAGIHPCTSPFISSSSPSLLGWLAHWLLGALQPGSSADLDEMDALAKALHDAEETRDQAIAYLQQREAELTGQLSQTEAELRAAMDGLREARHETEELRRYIEAQGAGQG